MRTPPQILIVEDNPESLDIFQTRLAAHGYEILTASDGEEALAIAREKQPDLILLDIMMPKLNGVEVCRRLKEDPSLPFMPIVMVTALADPKDVVVGLEAGADEYLAKPVDQTALVARVKSMLRIKSLHDTGQEQAARLEAQAVKLSEWNQKLEERVIEQVKRIGRLDKLKRFLSPHVAELVTESNNESLLESHRQYITTLFCDLRGFTAFSENIEPEESMELLRSYHEEIGRLVFKFDGTIDHRAGDGLMVIFNDPVPCDAPVEQALNLAFAMRDRVRELAKVWQKRGYELGFGIGITSGYATLGIVGFEGRFDYTANGNVVNLAARLCDIAKNDQIIISQNVYSEIENLVDAKPLTDLHLKGIRRPVRAFNVVRLRKNPGAITGSEAVGSPDCG